MNLSLRDPGALPTSLRFSLGPGILPALLISLASLCHPKPCSRGQKARLCLLVALPTCITYPWKPAPGLMAEQRALLSVQLPSLSSASCSVKRCPPGSLPGLPISTVPTLKHVEPWVGSLPGNTVPDRTNGVNLALLCRDMPLPGEGRGFLDRALVLSAEVCLNVSREQAKVQ